MEERSGWCVCVREREAVWVFWRGKEALLFSFSHFSHHFFPSQVPIGPDILLPRRFWAGTVHLRAQCSPLKRTEFDKMAACRIVDMCTYIHVESDGECVLRSGDDDVGSSGCLSVSCRSVSSSPLIAVGGKRSLLFPLSRSLQETYPNVAGGIQ